MAFDIGINLLKDVFLNTSMFGNFWIYQLLVLFGSMIIITRSWKDWGDIAFPLVVGWGLIGFTFNYVFYIVTGMIFVLNSISIREISGGLSAIGNVFKERKLLGRGIRGRIPTREERLNKKLGKAYDKQIANMEARLKVGGRQEKIDKMKEALRQKRLKGALAYPEGTSISDVLLDRSLQPSERISNMKEVINKEREISPIVRNQVNKDSWEFFKERGSMGKNAPAGTLADAIRKKAGELGRRLTDSEVESLYRDIGKRLKKSRRRFEE